MTMSAYAFGSIPMVRAPVKSPDVRTSGLGFAVTERGAAT